ncbi:MucB/RseB C-terminal domain-containing protein [Polaromonas sp. CG_9.11]|uniref:MucB/RseB C-terminal domain-containing protein n=1 Tax=Polaromonas sp. CG_9.11 TaxID=2787730 RepID=UPI0018CA7CB3|nr:MucB/RseB C-terminal domain-containing protein [Polaromonas sp. CG_9.11]
MIFKNLRLFPLALSAFLAMNCVAAQVLAAAAPPTASPAEVRSLNDWLMRMHQASVNQSYVGTFVVSAGGNMSSAKIWHVCEGTQQVERVETLTGAPRSIFRHNDQVTTFMPDHKVARSEKRESLGLFPQLFQSADSRIADFYKFRQDGMERVAGLDADIIMLVPRDRLRFGYRVWSERKNGLIVRLQTLDTDGKVIEEAAFSELQLDAPVSLSQLVQMMGKVQGYRLEKPAMVKTTAAAEGWALKTPVSGFNPMNCYKRSASVAGTGAKGATGDGPLQWIFSDGLTSVSIFVEPFDRQRHVREAALSLGATQTLTRQLDDHWITLVGEVPVQTLQMFANALERKK